MEVKVHWIIDGIAEMDVETLEEAEQKVDEVLRAVIGAVSYTHLTLPTTR